eukprot:gene4310-5894_t
MVFGETADWSFVVVLMDCMLVARCRRRLAVAVVAATVAYLTFKWTESAR